MRSRRAGSPRPDRLGARPGRPGERARGSWLEGSGCDAVLLHTSTDDPIETATGWNRDLLDRPEEFADALDRWLAYYRELGIEQLGYACLVLRKRADGQDGWLRAQLLPTGGAPPGGPARPPAVRDAGPARGPRAERRRCSTAGCAWSTTRSWARRSRFGDGRWQPGGGDAPARERPPVLRGARSADRAARPGRSTGRGRSARRSPRPSRTTKPARRASTSRARCSRSGSSSSWTDLRTTPLGYGAAMAEATGSTAPLRRDVRLLGGILGRVLVEQGGEGLLEDEERIRALAREARSGAPHELVRDAVRGLALDRQAQVLRAFALYFQLANIAEQHHRLRRRRQYEHAPRESLAEALALLEGQPRLERGRATDLARARPDRAPDRGGAPHDPRRAHARERAPARARHRHSLARRGRGAARGGGDDAVADRRGARAAPARRRRDPQRPLVLRAEPLRRRAAARRGLPPPLPRRARAAPVRHLDRRRPGREPGGRRAETIAAALERARELALARLRPRCGRSR